jgi:hypothetical protein
MRIVTLCLSWVSSSSILAVAVGSRAEVGSSNSSSSGSMARALEQVKLPGRLLGGRSPDHDEPARTGPALGLVEELRCGHLARDPVIPQGAEAPLDRPGEPRHHHVLRAAGLQRSEHLVVEEGGIGQDAHFPDPPGNLAQASASSGSVVDEAWVFPVWKLATHTSRMVPSKQSRGRYEGWPYFFRLKPMAAFSWQL